MPEMDTDTTPLVPWKDYAEFCDYYGFTCPEEIKAIFKRVKAVTFEALLFDPETTQVIIAIQSLPQYQAYKDAEDDDFQPPKPALIDTDLELLLLFQKKLNLLLENIQDDPEQVARAWLQLIASMEALPPGIEKTRYLLFLNKTQEHLIKKGYLLPTVDRPTASLQVERCVWHPALDLLIRHLEKQPKTNKALTPTILWEVNQLNNNLQTELISTLASFIDNFDEAIFIENLRLHPDHLELTLTLIQHVPKRFAFFIILIEQHPNNAPIIINTWENHIPRLTPIEIDISQKSAKQLQLLIQNHPTLSHLPIKNLLIAHQLAQLPQLTTREANVRNPPTPRDRVSKIIGAALFQIAALPACLMMGVKAHYLIGRHVVKKLIREPDNKVIEWAKEVKTGYLTMLQTLGLFYTRTRLFEDTGDETFISMLSNACRIYCDASLLQKFGQQLNRAENTDAEFYAEHLYHPEGFTHLWKTLKGAVLPYAVTPPQCIIMSILSHKPKR